MSKPVPIVQILKAIESASDPKVRAAVIGPVGVCELAQDKDYRLRVFIQPVNTESSPVLCLKALLASGMFCRASLNVGRAGASFVGYFTDTMTPICVCALSDDEEEEQDAESYDEAGYGWGWCDPARVAQRMGCPAAVYLNEVGRAVMVVNPQATEFVNG